MGPELGCFLASVQSLSSQTMWSAAKRASQKTNLTCVRVFQFISAAPSLTSNKKQPANKLKLHNEYTWN